MALSDLYALIPEEGYILGTDLPDVFARYEAQRGTTLLQPSEREQLRAFGRDHPAERVDAGVLVGLIGQLISASDTGGAEEGERGKDGKGDEAGAMGIESGRITKTPFKGAASLFLY